MKRIFAVLLAVVVLSSMAVIATSAAGATLTVDAVEVVEGTTEAVVNVVLSENAKITSLKADVAYDDTKITLTSIKKGDVVKEYGGQYVNSETISVNPQVIYWVIATEDTEMGGSVATMTFKLPEDAKAGDKFDLTLKVYAEDTKNVAKEEVAVEAISGSISVVAKTEAPTEAPTETEAPTAAPTEAPKTEAPTEAPTSKAPNKNPQTADMAVIAFAVMVVALGTAVVVKKVSAK